MNELTMKFLLFCLIYGSVRLTEAADQGNVVKETMKFLNDGERHLEIDANYRDLILLIGNTGNGKSTLTLFITKDLADLNSVDKGGFQIQYKYDGIIGTTTTVSQTIYPARFLDNLNVPFYDCPGFDDTRNTSIEIAATYFMKKVVDYAHTIKFVLVANYESVHRAGSRDAFALLVDHVRSFIKNIDNHKDSIAIVVTKVENEPRRVSGVLSLVPDDEMIQRIALFFIEYRDELNKKPSTPFTKYALALIEILLASKDGGKTYEKIAIIRKPLQAGPLSKFDVFVKEREFIRNVITNNLVYSPRIDGEYGYTISKESMLKMYDIAQDLSDSITTNVKLIAEEIQNFYLVESKLVGNPKALSTIYDTAYTSLSSLTQDTTIKTIGEFISKLMTVTVSLKIPITPDYLNNITTLANYIKFQETFSDYPLQLNVNDWKTALKDSLNYLMLQSQWNRFLNGLYIDYAAYDFRMDITKYNVADINNWGIAGKEQGIFITTSNFAIFASKQKMGDLMKGFVPTQEQLVTLNHLLDITIKNVPSQTCSGTELLVQGDFVRIADIDLTKCGPTTTAINIYALHTVYIDADINGEDKHWQVTIIAPRWYVYGDRRTINLNGRNGADAQGTGVASDSLTAGKPGIVGEPGNSAGHMTGIGYEFVNGNYLVITAVAGNGGRGQDGGAGFNGPRADIWSVGKGSADGHVELDQRKFRLTTVVHGKDCHTTSGGRGITWKDCKTQYYIADKCGTAAGDGGHGGPGGNTGHVKMSSVGTPQSFQITTGQGKDGTNGKAGTPGSNANKVLVQYLTSEEHPVYKYTQGWHEISSTTDDTCPPIGSAYDGGNAAGLKDPQIVPNDFPLSLVRFLSYLRDSQGDTLRGDDLEKFVQAIWNDYTIVNDYTVIGFVKELQSIEEQFFRLHNSIDFGPYYRSLCKRVETFAIYLKGQQQLTAEYFKLLNYVYTAAWGKYLSLNTIAQPYLIIDISTYLASTIETINDVKQAERQKIISDAQHSYYDDIQKKIAEANGFIETEIQPAISHISDSLDSNLKDLIAEVEQLYKKIAKQEKEYLDQQQKLKNQMGIRAIFHILGIVGPFVGFLGPTGEVAGSVLGTVTQLGEGFTNPNFTKIAATGTVPAGVKAAIEKSKQILLERKKKSIEIVMLHATDIIDDAGSSSHENVRPVVETAHITQTDLNEASTSADVGPDAIVPIENRLNEAVDQQTASLEAKADKTEDDKKTLEKLKKWSKLGSVAGKLPDVYKQFKSDQAKMDEVDKAIKLSEAQLEQLRQYESSILTMMWPMVNEVRNKINEIESALPGKSVAALDLAKWRVQSMLGDMKFKLTAFTKGFETQEELVNTVDKLNEAFATLINVYDRIDAYGDQQKLSDFIAQVSSADMTNIQINDPTLKDAYLNLDLIITSNVLLAKYKLATDAFKQSVFPFITYYLNDYYLPSTLIGSDTQQLVSNAARQLKNLQSKLNEYNKASINGNDRLIINAKFDNHYVTSDPFYVWPSKNNKLAINDLLAGKRINLYADIMDGIERNAIKFKSMELYIRTDDPARQVALDQLLTYIDVNMTHMGNSYYRCDANYYQIPNEPISIYYSNVKDNQGVPLRKSNEYTKLLKGEYMLSPYTMWSMQLVDFGTNTFDKLQEFTDRIDLELVGDGQYVVGGISVCNGTLDQYYRVDRTITSTIEHNVDLNLYLHSFINFGLSAWSLN